MEQLLSGSPLLMLQEKGTLLSGPGEHGRRKAFYTQQLSCTPGPGKGREGQKQPQNRGERKDRDGKFYL